MTRECPFCRKTDIADDALKCHHCGSWLDEKKTVDEFEAFRREMLTVVSADLEKHRTSTEKILTRMQVFAVVIAGVAGAFAYYFTGVTKENITQTSDRITEAANREVAEAADDAKEQAIKRVDAAVEDQMNSPEMAKLIADQIAKSVRLKVNAEVEEQLEGVEQSVEARVSDTLEAQVAGMQREVAAQAEIVVSDLTARFEAEASEQLSAASGFIEEQVMRVQQLAASQTAEAAATLAAVNAEIAEVRGRTEAALQSVAQLEQPYRDAQTLTVGDIGSVLEFQTVEASGKAGPEQIPVMMEQRINALSFVLGGFYDGPISWKYFDRLNTLHEFRYAILVDRNGSTALGFWDSRALAEALNPPLNDEMAYGLGPDPFELPSDTDVPEWVEFANSLGDGYIDALTAFAGFTPIADSVATDLSNFEALEKLERLGAEKLPVVDADGALVGFVERSRLTTRMLLEVAKR